ncbi:MAG: T9SS type A sorting domain-containing protein [Bacteroidales bacterium]|nr:T9SS type A sorting domain-containing protein [Bacteroidales bacterium]MCF8457799.1 T9SS type A sorting domain-containing protein [Bacteroidales bacterium]
MKRRSLPLIKQITLLTLGLVLSTAAFSQPGWSYVNTGSNHSIMIPDGVTYINGNPIEIGDYIGLFYDASGTMECCGFTTYQGAIMSITAWGAEAGMDNGYQAGEVFNWKVWKATLNMEFDAIATYLPTLPQQGIYMTNGISGVASLMTSDEIIPAVTGISCYGQNNGAIDITVNFGTSPYSFAWSNGATTEDLTNLAGGSYTITVTDALAVSNSLSLTVQEPLELVANILVHEGDAFMCEAYAKAYPFGGTAPYTYTWDDPAMQTTSQASNLCPGVYHITVTDWHSCQIDTSIIIDPSSPTVTDSAFTLIDTCLLNNTPDTAYISNLYYTASTMEIEWTIIEGANVFVFNSTYSTITSPGIYYVGLVINCGTKFITTISLVSIIEITPQVFSINTIKPNEFSCVIHPNPIQEDLNLQVFNATGNVVKVEIYNAIGGKLLDLEIELNANKQNTIALPDLSPGIYFAKVYNEFNQNAVIKFIK